MSFPSSVHCTAGTYFEISPEVEQIPLKVLQNENKLYLLLYLNNENVDDFGSNNNECFLLKTNSYKNR